MRITGLASGLDIDSMVKKLMTAERAPMDKLSQQKQQVEWKREGYREVSTKLVGLNEKISSLSFSSAIDSKKALVSGATGVITANATGASTNSVMNIQVSNLATASSVVSQGSSVPANTNASTKLSDLPNSAIPGNVKIGEATIDLTADDTIASFVNKINGNKSTGVTAVYDSASGKLSLSNKATGSNDITLSGSLLKDTFGIDQNNVNKGSDATVIINGLETKQSSNKFTVNGVEITLNGVTPANQSTQIEVTADVDKMMDTVKSFVAAYNDTISSLNQKTGEERYRKYLPLTTEQREAMSDDQAKLWDEKAKSGLLKNDSVIDKALGDMRTALISDVVLPNGEKVNLTQFGITTGNYQEKGKLVIDENKLRAALESTPEKVTALFAQKDSNSSSKAYTANEGLFSRIRKIDNNALQILADKAGTSIVSSDLTTAFQPQSQIGNQIRDLDTRISDWKSKLTTIENRYYKQFSSMETAMNNYNSTASSLAGLLS